MRKNAAFPCRNDSKLNMFEFCLDKTELLMTSVCGLKNCDQIKLLIV